MIKKGMSQGPRIEPTKRRARAEEGDEVESTMLTNLGEGSQIQCPSGNCGAARRSCWTSLSSKSKRQKKIISPRKAISEAACRHGKVSNGKRPAPGKKTPQQEGGRRCRGEKHAVYNEEAK